MASTAALSSYVHSKVGGSAGTDGKVGAWGVGSGASTGMVIPPLITKQSHLTLLPS